MSEWPPRSFDRGAVIQRRYLGGRPPPSAKVKMTPKGRVCVDFRCSVVDPLWVGGFSDAPGTMRGFPSLAERSHMSCVDSVGAVSIRFWKLGCVVPARLCVDP
ncbi:hypothetical protein NDU88_003851 [Pleurodeles waltl]|uniref:Uncharacterized protein n=1 Tax=Pleurodeles waltl TaxID=8319 RepID=A0AAV7TQ53_PLEWA|nr:hypothetical protein NDU88_003851 [Pleurodeles waltl]